ncbi:HTH domain-containing protein [Candidatus Woesearchaeota archaeon]|nr:HTH domain-containing protein [Candidatus Woesearchaeota archaeon]
MEKEKNYAEKNDELKEAILKICKERLTNKQKKILLYISQLEENLVITSLVERLSKEMNCSQSALWNNLNQLKRIGIIVSEKGKSVVLSSIGEHIAHDLTSEKEVKNDKNNK